MSSCFQEVYKNEEFSLNKTFSSSLCSVSHFVYSRDLESIIFCFYRKSTLRVLCVGVVTGQLFSRYAVLLGYGKGRYYVYTAFAMSTVLSLFSFLSFSILSWRILFPSTGKHLIENMTVYVLISKSSWSGRNG